MVEDSRTILEKFHELEKKCIGFENYVENDEKSYIDTLEKLRQLVVEI